MLVIGLTGGIGMGKTTTARILNRFGLPVYNADEAVHKLLAKKGKAVAKVARLFPESLKRGAIDRKILGSLVFGKHKQLKNLENILHPLVQHEERSFLKKAGKGKTKAAVLEIPLMYETGANKRCDLVICVTASYAVQKSRVMRRKGMTFSKFKAILRHQMPDRQRRRMADYTVHTEKGYAETKKQLLAILKNYDLP